MHHPKMRNPAAAETANRASTRADPGKWIDAESRPSPNVIQLPTVVVAVEADADAHGWHVRARQGGRLVYYRHAFGLLSIANREAAELSRRREFWWLA